MAELKVKVVPASSRNAITGWLGEALKIKVQSPPENGKANQAVIQYLAKQLGLPKADIELKAGATSPEKVLAIQNISTEQLATLIKKCVK